MRAIKHRLQRAPAAWRIRPRCFGLAAIGNGRPIEGVFFGIRRFLRMRWLQAAFVNGRRGHGFSRVCGRICLYTDFPE